MLVISLAIVSFTIIAQDTSESSSSVIVISGDVELVFDWTTERCGDDDIPDLPARAFRDNNEQVQLITTHFVGRRSIGSNLNDVSRDCNIIAESVYNPDPSQYSDKEWLASIFTEDGETIYALQHNEYQGHTHQGQCSSGDYFSCWYNSITLAVSTDSGASYSNISTPPTHLVASLPYIYETEAGPYGIFEPSNMFLAEDGYIYTFIRVDDFQSERQWVCLMRTNTIAEADSWRAWDGDDFTIRFENPYLNTDAASEPELCAPIAQNEIGVMHESLTYNTYLQKYVLVGTSADQLDGREVWGIYYSFSDDLIHWSYRQLLFETEFTWTYIQGDADPILYPSLIDPDSSSRNFSTTDETAYLYFTQFNYTNSQMTLDRDLMRIPIEFSNLSINVPKYEFTLEGTVPEGATRALVGYRINTECDCSGELDMTVHTIGYQAGELSQNLVPNSFFINGLANWNITGNAPYDLQDGSLSTGQMLSVTASDEQSSALTGAVFSVT